MTIDGKEARSEGNPVRCAYEKGYFFLQNLTGEHEIILKLRMEIRLWRANPLVKENIGKAALTRGPVVYCLEEADNGKNLHLLSIDPSGRFEETEESGELGNIIRISADGKRMRAPVTGGSLYLPAEETALPEDAVKLQFIPYYTWANRGSNEMTVWVRMTS